MFKIKHFSSPLSHTPIALVALMMPQLALAQISVKLENFLSVNTIEDLIVSILNILIVIAVPIVVFFIIYAGFLYVTARGNAQQIQQASRSLTYAIIGGVLILGAVALSQIIANVVGNFTGP